MYRILTSGDILLLQVPPIYLSFHEVYCTNSSYCWHQYLFRCVLASLLEGLSVRLSVRKSIRPSVRLSVPSVSPSVGPSRFCQNQGITIFLPRLLLPYLSEKGSMELSGTFQQLFRRVFPYMHWSRSYAC